MHTFPGGRSSGRDMNSPSTSSAQFASVHTNELSDATYAAFWSRIDNGRERDTAAASGSHANIWPRTPPKAQGASPREVRTPSNSRTPSDLRTPMHTDGTTTQRRAPAESASVQLSADSAPSNGHLTRADTELHPKMRSGLASGTGAPVDETAGPPVAASQTDMPHSQHVDAGVTQPKRGRSPDDTGDKRARHM